MTAKAAQLNPITVGTSASLSLRTENSEFLATIFVDSINEAKQEAKVTILIIQKQKGGSFIRERGDQLTVALSALSSLSN